MRRAGQSIMLGAYRVLFARGLLRFAWGRRLFLALYELYKSTFEAGLIGGLRGYAPPGALVIDVGANVGFFTLRFARWIGPSGRVIAIEPEAANHAELVRRLGAHDLSGRVEAHRAVADAKAGNARLVINPDHPGDHRIGDEGEPIPAVALDAVVPAGANVSLIKIDVQGAEMRVLAGAAAILARDKPALFVEVDPAGLARFGTGVDALLGWLAGFGYAPHRLTHAGAEPLDRAALDRVLAARGYTDLLFLAGRN